MRWRIRCLVLSDLSVRQKGHAIKYLEKGLSLEYSLRCFLFILASILAVSVLGHAEAPDNI